MRNKSLKILLTALLLTCFHAESLNGTRTIISGLGRPVGLNADKEQLYIIENCRIHIYALKDLKHIKSFGKQGQGPGEFHTLPHVPVTLDCSTDDLIVGSIRKISYLTKHGEPKSEVKGINLAYKLVYLDTRNGKDRFLGWSRLSRDKFNYNTIVVFDHQLNKIKQIYEAKDPFQGPGNGYDILTKVFDFVSHGGKIIIPGKDSLSLDVLDMELNTQFSLVPEAEPVPVSESFRKSLLRYLKTSPETKNAYPMIKPVRFPEYFPVISSFFADSGILYLMTWEKTETGHIFYLYRPDGGLIGKRSIPVRYETETQPYPMAVKNGKFFQLVEHTESEEWELIVHPVQY